jgi:hypothetical protein
MSMRPGIRNIPRPSMRRASDGTGVLPAGPTAAIRPPRTTTVAFLSGRSLVMVRTVTLVIARGSGSGPAAWGDIIRTLVTAASNRAGVMDMATSVRGSITLEYGTPYEKEVR